MSEERAKDDGDVDNITVPDGDGWRCATCGETGGADGETLKEHYEEEHDGLN